MRGAMYMYDLWIIVVISRNHDWLLLKVIMANESQVKINVLVPSVNLNSNRSVESDSQFRHAHCGSRNALLVAPVQFCWGCWINLAQIISYKLWYIISSIDQTLILFFHSINNFTFKLKIFFYGFACLGPII